jgi:hypothetical protein
VLLRRVVTIAFWSVLLILAVGRPATVFAGEDFPPISAEELKMTSEPLAPGAPAIILYREVDRDDNGLTFHEDNYKRIKIFTEEGRKYANIEIPFVRMSTRWCTFAPAPSNRMAPLSTLTAKL